MGEWKLARPALLTVRGPGYLPYMFIREVSDGTDLDQVLMVREIDKRVKRDGGEFLRLTLGDRSGAVVAMVWDDVPEVAPLVAAGQPVRVVGRYVVHPRYGPQLNLRTMSQAEPGTYELEELLDAVRRTGRTARSK